MPAVVVAVSAGIQVAPTAAKPTIVATISWKRAKRPQPHEPLPHFPEGGRRDAHMARACEMGLATWMTDLCQRRDPSRMAMTCRSGVVPASILSGLTPGPRGRRTGRCAIDPPLLRCRCGSDQFGIIVGVVSVGNWQPAPGIARHARPP
jgi:hypothetical protein